MEYFQPARVGRNVLEVYAAMVEKKEFDRKKKKCENEYTRSNKKETSPSNCLEGK